MTPLMTRAYYVWTRGRGLHGVKSMGFWWMTKSQPSKPMLISHFQHWPLHPIRVCILMEMPAEVCLNTGQNT